MKHELTEYGWLGTSLRGHITTTFDELVEVFGYPNLTSDKTCQADKTWWEWCVEFYDDVEDEYTIATVYDWKERSPDDARTGEYKWHIGGKNIKSLWAVMDALEKGGQAR